MHTHTHTKNQLYEREYGVTVVLHIYLCSDTKNFTSKIDVWFQSFSVTIRVLIIMGKNKQAQRTKNNARPSNSGKSAELLGTTVPTFVGFSAVKDGGYVPVLPGLSLCSPNEIEMNNVDDSFQIVLKKMHKKDSITKCKALQEFSIMCKDSELSAVEGMLPFWPRLYCALAIDVEHKVREGAQLAHAAVVKRVGRGIAMYLKQLAGVWFTSQYDTYPPAASVASNSFNETFSQKKVIDAIIFCQREILSYICDNITVHTAQTLSLQKNLTAEEMEAKYYRVLIASLQGYSSYLKKIPIQKVEEVADIHNKIISSSKFWKLVKCDVLPVKVAFFNVLTSIIENAEKLLPENEKKRTVTTIMNSLDEMEPILLSAVWETVLVTINKIKDWFSVVNIEKLVLPKLWRVLQNGGQCCASVVYPNLLPFISQFPKFNVNTSNLYINFFNNMRKGFSVKNVQISRSEMFAVITSFVECLRYSILLNINDQDLCYMLLKEQLIPILETCLKEKTPMKQIFFYEITHLVRYWSKNRHNEDYKSYSMLIDQFWQELNRLFNSSINDSQDSVSFDTTDRDNTQIEFLVTLKTAPAHNRKNLKVTFCSSEKDVIVQPVVQNIDNNTDTEFLAELNSLVRFLCTQYFDKITDDCTEKYIIYLNKLLTCFESDKLFSNLSKSQEMQINFFSFYDQILRKQLLEQSKEIKSIVELIFNLLKYMTNSEKNEVLKSLTQFKDTVIAKNVIQCALSKKYKNDMILEEWYSESQITKLLIDVTKEIASDNCSDLEKNQDLILLAFEPLNDGGLLISEEGVNEIVSILCNSIHEVDETCLLHFAKLISCIVPLTWTYFQQSMSGAVRALEMLFELCSEDSLKDNSDFLETIRDVWKIGLLETFKKIPQLEFVELTNKFSSIMWKKIYDSDEKHSKEMLVNLAADFLEILLNSTVNVKEECVEEIILTFLTNSDMITWMAEVTGLVLYGEVITGRLYVSTLDQKIQIYNKSMSIDLTKHTVPDNTENCLKWALFITNLLNSLCSRSANKDEEESDIEEALIRNMNLPGMMNILVNVIYFITLGQIYKDHYKSAKCYSNVNEIVITAQKSFKELQTHINEDIYSKILNHFKINYSNFGSMLSNIISFCCADLFANKKFEELFDIYNNNDVADNEEMILQGLQIILPEFENSMNISTTTDNDIYPLIVAKSTLNNQLDSVDCSKILERILFYDKTNPALLLLDGNINETSWIQMTLPLTVIRLLIDLIVKNPSKLTYEHWNFILVSLALWQLSVTKSKQNANDFKVAALTVAVCQLYCAVQNSVNKHEQQQSAVFPPELLNEWNNVFASDIQDGIVQTWLFYADLYNEKTTDLKVMTVLDYLGKSVKMLNGRLLFKNQSNIFSTASIDLDSTVKLSLKLLQSSVTSIQLGAYHLLKHAVLELVQRDKATVEVENYDLSTLNIRKLEDVLQNTQNIVNTILMDFKLCDTGSCTIQPYTDSYTYTLGYLLSWAIILDMCAIAEGDLLHQYAEILKDNFFPNLLNNIFRLMPMEVLQDNKNKSPKLMEIFSSKPCLDFGESWTEERLDHIVCWLYTNSLRHFPVLVRQWWSSADSKVNAVVDKITTHYVSPMLCQEEFVNNKFQNVDNMQVKVHPTFREVTALYQMDDTKLELNILLPPNYPLGPVTVEPGQHVSGNANWRNCHMQLSIFLTHQNGSVWDGLALWKRNLDKKFAGFEECCICFSIFHVATYQIPKLSCHTCRKKFHTTCLYKWFTLSQKSTCPICRNVF